MAKSLKEIATIEGNTATDVFIKEFSCCSRKRYKNVLASYLPKI